VIPVNNSSPINANINTIKILMKLLEIKIVASNFLGFFNSFTTAFCLFELDSFASSISVRDNEKKAISVPEIKAEQTKSINKIANLNKNILLKIANEIYIKLKGSGSNYFLIKLNLKW
jgi:hypothetical protein